MLMIVSSLFCGITQGELILMATDSKQAHLAVNLVLNLRRLQLDHILLVADSQSTCDVLHVRPTLIS